jgi:hypothetical protein
MAQVNSENSTTAPAVSTRRRFLSNTAGIAAGGAALAVGTGVNVTAIAATRPAAAAPSVALDGSKVSQELRDLAGALDDAEEAIKTTQGAFDAEYELYDVWLKRNPEPRDENRRAWRKWNGRHKRYMSGSNFYARQDAHAEAAAALRKACGDVAKYRARDMNELVHVACLVIVYESESKPRYSSYSIISQGVALDVARMGTIGLAVAS